MIVSVRGLAFGYPGAGVDVLKGMEFDIREGEVFGFLGPNGSGKSTTQKLLAKILPTYRGDVTVFGESLANANSDYYNRIGVCFEFPNLYNKLTAEENLEFYRGFFDGPTEDPKATLERFDLPVGDRRRVGQFSKGMKMRLVLARSLINRPQLWFLDEPTTGQDPQHAVAIRELIREKANNGTTVFLTTHNMTVADELCDRVAFIDDGQLQVVARPRDLKLKHARRVVRVEYRGADGSEIAEFNLEAADEKNAFIELVRDREVETIHTQEPSLEDVFIEVTGRKLI